MYEVFAKLCEKNHVTPYKVSKETGISRSTLSDWKTGKSVPKADKLEKIASYFGVTIDYLQTGKEIVEIFVDRGHKELEGTEYYIEVHADPEKFTSAALDRWNEFEKRRWLTPIEKVLLANYNAADPGTKAAVRKLLDIPDEEPEEEQEDDLMPIAAHAMEGATTEDQMKDLEMMDD